MLPNPSPLTVEILQRAARFDGGIGRSWRRIGFRYARSGASDRQFETIGGRVFLDLSASVRASADDLPLVLDSRRLHGGGFSAGAPAAAARLGRVAPMARSAPCPAAVAPRRAPSVLRAAPHVPQRLHRGDLSGPARRGLIRTGQAITLDATNGRVAIGDA
jgi:hypothetical protein